MNFLHFRLTLGRGLHRISKLYILVLLLHLTVDLLDERCPLGELARTLAATSHLLHRLASLTTTTGHILRGVHLIYLYASFYFYSITHRNDNPSSRHPA